MHGIRVYERDLEPEEPVPRPFVDQLGAPGRRARRAPRRHPRPRTRRGAFRARACSRNLPTGVSSPSEASSSTRSAADPQRGRLDSLLRNGLAALERSAEEPLVGRDRLVEILDRDAKMVDSARLHAADAIEARVPLGAAYSAATTRTVPAVSEERDSGSTPSSSSASSPLSSVSLSRSASAIRSSADRCFWSRRSASCEGVVGETRLLLVPEALGRLGEGVVVSAHRARGRRVGHPEVEDHRACQLRRLLEVVRGAVRDPAEDDLLGGAAREVHHQKILEFLGRMQVALLAGQVERVAERLPAGDDRHLVHRQRPPVR